MYKAEDIDGRVKLDYMYLCIALPTLSCAHIAQSVNTLR